MHLCTPNLRNPDEAHIQSVGQLEKFGFLANMEVEFKNLQKNFSVIFSSLKVKFGANLNKLSSEHFVLGPHNDDLLKPYFWAQGTNTPQIRDFR